MRYWRPLLVLLLSVFPLTMVRASLIGDGLNTAASGTGLPTTDIRTTIGDILRYVVTFVALAALVAIVAAGIIFIVGGGSETAIQRGKRIILYTVVGLFIVFLARVLVLFVTQDLAGVAN